MEEETRKARDIVITRQTPHRKARDAHQGHPPFEIIERTDRLLTRRGEGYHDLIDLHDLGLAMSIERIQIAFNYARENDIPIVCNNEMVAFLVKNGFVDAVGVSFTDATVKAVAQ